MNATVPEEIAVTPVGHPLGAEVTGVDLSKSISEGAFKKIRAAWLDHLVLVFRGQTLTDEHLVGFAARFGTPYEVPFAEYDRSSALLPEIDVISNIVTDGQRIGALGAGEAAWHTDMSVFDEPASATMLYGLEIPSTGGNTRFANMYAAYESLPQMLRSKIEGRTSTHDLAYNASGQVRKGFAEVADKTKGPGAVHPIVRTHPDTHRRALFLGRRGNGYIQGLSVGESDSLLELLWAHMTRPEFMWEHIWRAGDLIIWDNRCVIHGRGAFDESARRLLHRVTVKGEKPR